MAAARKRLPKELQDFKRELKELTFYQKVKAYFDCAPFMYDLDGLKMDIILKSFSKDERGEYYRRYEPIYNAIDRFGDRIRAINGNRIIYGNYLDKTFKQRDTLLYTADFLNLALPMIAEALEGTKEESTKKKLTEALTSLKGYRRVSIVAPEIGINKKGTSYEVKIEAEDRVLKGIIQTLRDILSLLKCYLEALKEFLEWVGTPELLPKEFDDMEKELLSRYNPIDVDSLRKDKAKNLDAKKFPLYFADYDIVEEYLSIDYKEIPLAVDISKENNLFVNYYRSFFKY